MKKLEELLNDLKKSAIVAYENLPKDYPIAENVPVTLFGPTGNGQRETSYTRALAFLLDQNGNHGFGRSIFDKLCEKIKLNAKSAKDYEVISEFISKKKKGFDRFDIRIDGDREQTKDKFLIIIEAKINASFGKKQLDNYKKYIKDQKATKKYLITLTKEKIDPILEKDNDTDIKHISLTWYDIFDTIWETINRKTAKNKKGFHFAQMFCSSISQDIYENDTEWSDIYNFVSLDECKITQIKDRNDLTLDLYIKYPMTCAVISDNLEEDCEFVRQYNNIRNDFKDKANPFLDKLGFGNISYKDSYKLRSGRWNEDKKQGIYLHFLTKMDSDREEKLHFIIDIYYTSIENKKIAESQIKKHIPLPKTFKSWTHAIVIYKCDINQDFFTEKTITEIKEILKTIKDFI